MDLELRKQVSLEGSSTGELEAIGVDELDQKKCVERQGERQEIRE